MILNVINVEDSPKDSELIRSELASLGYELVFTRVNTTAKLHSALESENVNLIISNYTTEHLDCLEAIEVSKSLYSDLPFILVSGQIGEEGVADMMRAGVEDFVLKNRLERLPFVVKRILQEHEIKNNEAKAQRIASEAHAAKEQMLAIVSHDIKNPLSAIRLEAQMLLRVAGRHEKSTLAEEVKIQANRILKTTDRLKILISDLLDKNKTVNDLSCLKLGLVNVSKLFQEVLDATRAHLRKKNIKLKTTFPQSDLSLSLDRNKMFQVLTNLLNNAVKFTPEDGEIHFSVEEGEQDYIISICDSGPGLEPEDLPKVFDKYWSGSVSSNSGTGLGLFICKTIIEAHKGHIMVENSSSRGARFFFTIPKPSETSQAETHNYSGNSSEEHRKRILIVDDDEDLREVMSWALDKEGFATSTYHDPWEALQFLKKGINPPHLILADYHMNGMKGGEFLNLKNTYTLDHSCPVLMISASPGEVVETIPRELYKEIITKPIDLEGLIANLKKYLA